MTQEKLPTDDNETGSSGGDNSGENEVAAKGVSFALIHEATSLTDYQELDDPDSITAQVARGRGKGNVTDRVTPDDDNGPGAYNVRVEEGRLKTETGYVVRFISDDMVGLSPFDVIGVDSIKAYPAPKKMIDSLTPRIRGYLKEHGYVQVRGAYSPDDSRFYGVKLGWDVSEDIDPWDRLMEVIEQVSTTPAAVDYVFVEEGPERWDVEEIARVRGVKPESIRGNVRAVENELDN